MSKMTKVQMRRRRHQRLRQKIKGTSDRPRLCISRGARNFHAQLIDDVAGKTLVSANTLQSSVADKIEGAKGNKEAAKVVGEAVARLAQEKGVECAVFDRNGYAYHGVVAEFATAVREGGLRI